MMACPRLPGRADSAWFAVAYLVLHVGFVIWIDCGPVEVYDAEGGKRLRLLQELHSAHPETPVLTFIGSSRMIMGVLPSRLQPLETEAGQPVLPFNYVHQGAGPAMNLMNLHRLLRHELRPSWLVLEIVPSFLAKDSAPTTTMALADLPVVLRHGNRAKVWLWCCRNRQHPFQRHSQAVLYRQAPAFTTRRSPLEILGLTPLGEANGWMACEGHAWDSPEKHERVIAETKKSFYPQLQQFRIDPKVDASTREALEVCKRHGIPVLVVLLPEDSAFRTWYTPEAEKSLREYLAELEQTYGVRVADTRAWIADEGFFDPHHLNLTGARQYTDRLAREMIRPFVKETSR